MESTVITGDIVVVNGHDARVILLMMDDIGGHILTAGLLRGGYIRTSKQPPLRYFHVTSSHSGGANSASSRARARLRVSVDAS